jgi:hypothetical protein
MPELHRIHAVVQASRVEMDDVDMVWRGEGGSLELKRQAAYGFALCWNVLEGIPTTALEAGAVRDLIAAIQAGEMTRAQELAARMVDAVDLTNGRPHDCTLCLANAEDR